jgi:hypothetical protein
MDIDSPGEPPPLRVFRADPRSVWKLYVAAAAFAPLFLDSAAAGVVVAFHPEFWGDFGAYLLAGIPLLVSSGFMWFLLSHAWCNKKLGVVVRSDSVTFRHPWPQKERTYALADLRCVERDPGEGDMLLRRTTDGLKSPRHGIYVSPELFASSAEQQEFMDLMNDLIRRPATSAVGVRSDD